MSNESPSHPRRGTADRARLLAAAAVIVTGALFPPEFWPVHGVLLVLVFAAQSLARIPLSYLRRRLALFLPVVCLLSLSFPLAQGFRDGWAIAAAILLRTTLAFMAALWLVNVVPLERMLIALRRLYLPEVLVAMLAFMHRYVFVLWDELERMRTARRARSFGPVSFRQRWSGSTQVIGMLLIRAMDRAGRVHGAMCARGWDGRIRTLDDAGSSR
jgi:cobalt/nickel transport system permease protein